MTDKHTQGPYRVGDAGHTIFGPPNGTPSPQTIATVRLPADARHLAHCANVHDEMLATLQDALFALGPRDDASTVQRRIRAAIAKATQS